MKRIFLALFAILSFSLFAQSAGGSALKKTPALAPEQAALHPADRWYSAQRPDYSELDERVRGLAKNEANPQDVAKIVCEGLESDIEKARAIFDWLSYNIAYDTSFKTYHAADAFKKRKGVCQGYAELFQEMADAVGLDSYMVSGTGYGGPSVGRGGHAWNMVRLKERDLLLDSCWGAGYVMGGGFTFKYDPSWFDPHPAVFLYTHYPDDAVFACVSPVISKEKFNRMLYLKPENYFPYGSVDPVNDYASRCGVENLSYTPISLVTSRAATTRYEYVSTGDSLLHGFFILNREVIYKEIFSFIGEEEFKKTIHGQFQNDWAAVCGLSIELVARYCNALSVTKGFEECFSIGENGAVSCDFSKNGIRVPTKKEWLLAAGQKDFDKSMSESDFACCAWYDANNAGTIHEVSQTRRNSNGLCDMLGNVNEICWDEDSNQYVLMGGTVDDSMDAILSFEPLPFDQAALSKNANCGLRLVYKAPTSAEGQLIVAMGYLEGNLLPKDAGLYARWLDLSAQNGSPKAMALRAGLYYLADDEESLKKCYELCVKASESEQPYALNIMARLYLYGKHVEKDERKAFEFYERSAKAGNLDAMYNTAQYFRQGKVVEQNDQEYFNWLKRAVEGGYSDENAKIELGQCYANGIGCEKSSKNARQGFLIFAELAKKDDSPTLAIVECADCYAAGIGVGKSWYYAIKMYEKAVKKGSVYAKAKLADCAFNASGMKRDIPKAIAMYKEIIDAGFDKPPYRTTYDHYQAVYNIVSYYDDKCECFLSMVPNETSPYEYLDAALKVYIESEKVSGHPFAKSQLLAGLSVDFMKKRMLEPLQRINEGKELSGKTLVALVSSKEPSMSSLQKLAYSSPAFSQTKYKVNGEYYNNDESFFGHYDNVIMLESQKEADQSLAQAFEKIKSCSKNCSEFDVLCFSSNLFKAGSPLSAEYVQIAKRLVEKGVRPRIICLGNRTDAIQLNVNKIFSEADANKICVFGTPANMQGEMSCAFRKGNLFIVLLTERVNGKRLLIYLDQTGWAPEPTRQDVSFVQNQQSLGKMASLGPNEGGTVSKSGKMVMHYKVCK